MAEELGSLGLHSVEQSKRCRRSTEPDRAAVLKARAHMRFVDGCELGARDDMASTVQMGNGLGGRFGNVGDVGSPRQLARESQADNFEGQALGKGVATKHKVGVGAGCRTEGKLAVLVQRVGAKGGQGLDGRR